MSDNHGILSNVRIINGVLTMVETETFDPKDGDIESIEALVAIPDDEDDESCVAIEETDIVEEHDAPSTPCD